MTTSRKIFWIFFRNKKKSDDVTKYILEDNEEACLSALDPECLISSLRNLVKESLETIPLSQIFFIPFVILIFQTILVLDGKSIL